MLAACPVRVVVRAMILVAVLVLPLDSSQRHRWDCGVRRRTPQSHPCASRRGGPGQDRPAKAVTQPDGGPQGQEGRQAGARRPTTAACPGPAPATRAWPARSACSACRPTGPAPRWTGAGPATWRASNLASPHDPELANRILQHAQRAIGTCSLVARSRAKTLYRESDAYSGPRTPRW